MANVIPYAFRGELFTGTHNFASGGDQFKLALYTANPYDTSSTVYVTTDEVSSAGGTNYTDILATCLLDYGEPSGQDAIDNATGSESLYVFDELGLVSYAKSGTGRLLTHVVFHPVQKSLNRLIQIDYTVRVQSLTGFNEA